MLLRGLALGGDHQVGFTARRLSSSSALGSRPDRGLASARPVRVRRIVAAHTARALVTRARALSGAGRGGGQIALNTLEEEGRSRKGDWPDPRGAVLLGAARLAAGAPDDADPAPPPAFAFRPMRHHRRAGSRPPWPPFAALCLAGHASADVPARPCARGHRPARARARRRARARWVMYCHV